MFHMVNMFAAAAIIASSTTSVTQQMPDIDFDSGAALRAVCTPGSLPSQFIQDGTSFPGQEDLVRPLYHFTTLHDITFAGFKHMFNVVGASVDQLWVSQGSVGIPRPEYAGVTQIALEPRCSGPEAATIQAAWRNATQKQVQPVGSVPIVRPRFEDDPALGVSCTQSVSEQSVCKVGSQVGQHAPGQTYPLLRADNQGGALVVTNLGSNRAMSMQPIADAVIPGSKLPIEELPEIPVVVGTQKTLIFKVNGPVDQGLLNSYGILFKEGREHGRSTATTRLSIETDPVTQVSSVFIENPVGFLKPGYYWYHVSGDIPSHDITVKFRVGGTAPVTPPLPTKPRDEWVTDSVNEMIGATKPGGNSPKGSKPTDFVEIINPRINVTPGQAIDTPIYRFRGDVPGHISFDTPLINDLFKPELPDGLRLEANPQTKEIKLIGIAPKQDEPVKIGVNPHKLPPGVQIGDIQDRWHTDTTVAIRVGPSTPPNTMKPFNQLRGGTRHETTTRVIREVWGDAKYRTIFVTRDDNNTDALLALPVSANRKIPIVQTTPLQVTPVTEQFIANHLEPGGDVIIVGGHVAVSSKVEQDLKAKGYHVTRMGGKTRVETANTFAQWAGMPTHKTDEYVLSDQTVVSAAAEGYTLSFNSGFPKKQTTTYTITPYLPGDRVTALFYSAMQYLSE